MSPLSELIGLEMLGRYKLEEQIGAGAFGVIYRGRDPYIGRELAVKVSSLDDVGGDRSQQQSFLRKLFIEAEAAGGLMHPNITMIYDVGIQEPYYYIAMEYVEGRNLKYHCQLDQRLSIADIIDTTIKICHGLDYAHQRGIVHRDIKSTNILIGKRGEVKIADFGLAYIDAVKESQIPFAGTPSYMSPEQIRRERPTARSDIFSLGIVLYELLCCRKPFVGRGDEVEKAILKKDPEPILSLNADVPPGLVAVVERALQKEPQKRFSDAMECAEALDGVLRGGMKSFAPELVEKIQLMKSLLFFSEFSEDEIHSLINIGTWMSCCGGDLIVAQEEEDTSFFVIIAGSAAVMKERRSLGSLGRGQCFGEISFLLGGERTATVSAVSDCQLLKLNPKKIDILPVEMQAKLYRMFAKNLANRLLSADRRTVDQ